MEKEKLIAEEEKARIERAAASGFSWSKLSAIRPNRK